MGEQNLETLNYMLIYVAAVVDNDVKSAHLINHRFHEASIHLRADPNLATSLGDRST